MYPIYRCVDDDNKPNQETFKCTEYGFESNADYNATINIRNRVCKAVLLNQLDNGAYEPKKFKREKVKDALLSLRGSGEIYKKVF